MAKTFQDKYTGGEYLANRPGWHSEHSSWKAGEILRIIRRNTLTPQALCEVGCGAGEVLKQLQLALDEDCTFTGYDISPQAHEISKEKANERLHFKLGNFLQEEDAYFDLLLVIDVIEHVEDYFTFLRKIKPKSRYKIFHIPLDLSAQAVLRSKPLLQRREVIGHIHLFTKEIALQLLEDLDYTIIDQFYTTWAHDVAAFSTLNALMRLPRKLLFALNRDLAARLVGGYSLMVLAE